jgi:pimeloyl-ACP methyl ester carboxylesterase
VTSPAERVEPIDVRGTAIAVHIAGPAGGVPLLWVHGEGVTCRRRALVERLAERFRVIAPVLPGFGGTELPGWLDGVDDVALFLADLCDALGLGPASATPPLMVAGESLGGWIAATLAIWRPQLVHRLALIAPLGIRPAEPMPDLFIKPGPEALHYLSATMAADSVDPLTGDIDLATELWVEQAAQARLMWERPYDRKLVHRAHHITAPVTVVWGAADRLLAPSHATTVAGLFGAGDPTIIEGAGHLVSVDAPAALAATLTQAFSSTPGPR